MARVPLLLTQFRDVDDFVHAAQTTARAQRSADRARAARPGGGDARVRESADLCLAYSVKDGYFYVGYSNTVGGILYRRRRAVPTCATAGALERRPGHLHSNQANAGPASNGPDELLHALANCAEACALAVAQAWRQQLEDLAFVRFCGRSLDARTALAQDPCTSCQAWLPSAHAYHVGGQLRFGEACAPRRRSSTLFRSTYDNPPAAQPPFDVLSRAL